MLFCVAYQRGASGASDDSALESYIPAVSFCKTANLILEENIMGKSYKPITSMKEVPEQRRERFDGGEEHEQSEKNTT